MGSDQLQESFDFSNAILNIFLVLELQDIQRRRQVVTSFSYSFIEFL